MQVLLRGFGAVHPLDQRSGGFSRNCSEQDNLDAQLFQQPAFVLVDRLQRVISSLGVDVRPRAFKERAGIRFGKNANGINRFQGGQNGGPIVLAVERPPRPFERSNTGIAGDTHQQRVALVARLLKISDMAQVQNVEAPVGHHQFASGAAKVLAPGSEGGGVENLLGEVHCGHCG